MCLGSQSGQRAVPLNPSGYSSCFKVNGTQPATGGPKILAQVFGYEKYVTAISRDVQDHSLSDREKHHRLTFCTLLDGCTSAALPLCVVCSRWGMITIDESRL